MSRKKTPGKAARPATVAQVLSAQAPERRAEMERVRAVINAHLPKGYAESSAMGMITWEVPLAVYPDTYNGHPLWYAALGAHKSYLSLYLMMVYSNTVLLRDLDEGFRKAGKKLKMGKSCINFTSADELALDAIAEVVAAVPLEKYIAAAKEARRR